MSTAGFGTVIPVLGLNNGFLGKVSRIGERVIAARPYLSTAAANGSFGDPAVIVPDSLGGQYTSVANYIAQGGTFTAAKFAGVFVNEVKTALIYASLGNQNAPIIGSYAPTQMAEVLERGSMSVLINNGTPVQGNPLFVRITANGGIPAGVVGQFEAVADGANTVSLASVGVVFRTGVLDANNVAEITLLTRVAA